MDQIRIICIVGATASGKTGLGVSLAKQINGEIISADSMQVYRDMPIATAVATPQEQDGVPHHLINFLDNDRSYSVADFVRLASDCIDDIVARGRVPIVVGGTGLFVDSLVNDISFSDVAVDEDVRLALNGRTNNDLYAELVSVDPDSAVDIHPNNRKRVIRALELYYGGTTKTRQNELSRLGGSRYDALYIGINYRDRSVLYDRINTRVDIMMQNGLLDEARSCLSNNGATSRQAIGHKELKPYLDGEVSLDDAVDRLKTETRHYAKRQLTWFRRNENINWLYGDELDNAELVGKAVALARQHLDK